MTDLSPDSFKKDWYGYVTNQWGHVGVGLFLFIFINFGALMFSGELPYRSSIFLSIVAGYICWEYIISKPNGWDSVEDLVFVSYGAGFPAILFIEVEPGKVELSSDFYSIVVLSLCIVFHLAVGAIYRILDKNGF